MKNIAKMDILQYAQKVYANQKLDQILIVAKLFGDQVIFDD